MTARQAAESRIGINRQHVRTQAGQTPSQPSVAAADLENPFSMPIHDLSKGAHFVLFGINP